MGKPSVSFRSISAGNWNGANAMTGIDGSAWSHRVTLSNGKFYTVSGGSVYGSSDALNWSSVKTGIKSLVVSGDDYGTVWAVSQDGNLLKSTGREGVDELIDMLDDGKMRFFTAPASVNHHLNYDGGLLQHSLNVYDEAILVREMQLRIKPEIEARLPPDSIAIAALLHDVCKAEVYKPEQKSRKNSNGEWERYDGYRADYSGFPLGHGEKSVIRLLRWGLEMSDDEIIAIRWHMSGFDLAFQSPEIRSSYGEASDKCPLLAVLRAADGLASHILET